MTQTHTLTAIAHHMYICNKKMLWYYDLTRFSHVSECLSGIYILVSIFCMVERYDDVLYTVSSMVVKLKCLLLTQLRLHESVFHFLFAVVAVWYIALELWLCTHEVRKIKILSSVWLNETAVNHLNTFKNSN